MSDTLKPGKGTGRNRGNEELFELPRTIAQQLKECARKSDGKDAESVKYLWMNLSGGASSSARKMSEEEWLNVVDEAASLGVQFMVICVDDGFDDYALMWNVCGWAQATHDMSIGIHFKGKAVKAAALKGVSALKPALTWLFVSEGNGAMRAALEKTGFNVLHSDVAHEEPDAGCEGPKNLVYVGPEGMMYCCGVVGKEEDFSLGHVLDKPINAVLDQSQVRREVPKGFVRPKQGCDGCPNKMADRIRKT